MKKPIYYESKAYFSLFGWIVIFGKLLRSDESEYFEACGRHSDDNNNYNQ